MLVGPNELRVGVKYRLTGDACNARERDDKRVFTVLGRCLDDHGGGAHLWVKASDGETLEVEIAPWVQVLLIPEARA